MSTTRRTLGTGPELHLPERDERARNAFERAADGEWVEVPEPIEPRPTSGRRPLGPRGA